MASPEQSAPQDAAAPLGTIMHRKAQAGRAEHQARAMSLAKALRLTIAKTADTMFDMSMGVISVRRETRAREALDSALQAAGLRMIFDGPNRARAAVILDGNLVAALIQQQTMGKVLPDVDGATRDLTATDAAVCSPFIDAVLEKAASMAETEEDRQIIQDYRFGVWAEDARLLGMALEAQDYDLLHVDLDIAGGVRQGHALFCMPRADPLPTAQEDITAAGEDRPECGVQKPLLSASVLNLQAEVRISLSQVKMSLRELGDLEIGSVVDLGQARFDRVGVQTIAGNTLARGTLGQLEGQRAVRVQLGSQTGGSAVFSAGGATTSKDPDIALLEENKLPQTDGAYDGIADLPDLSDLPDLPDMSDLPDLPNIDPADELPELPELPDLSDLETP